MTSIFEDQNITGRLQHFRTNVLSKDTRDEQLYATEKDDFEFNQLDVGQNI